MTSPREALGTAIDAHTAALAAAKSAEATLARAAAYHNELTIKLSEFADVDARVAAERADAIRKAMGSGERPTFEMSAATKVAVAVRDAHDKELGAAQEAVEALRNEHATAVKAVERASLELEWAAEAVMVQEADALAAEYAATLSKARELYLAMWGMSVAPIRRPPHEISRINQSPTRALVLSPAAAIAVRDEDVKIETPSARRDVYRKQVRGAVVEWLDALKRDADARLEVPKECLRLVSDAEAA